MAGFSYLDRLKVKTGSFLLYPSAVSACLPSLSSRTLLTCLVAMSSAEDVGKGKSCLVCPLWIASG